MPDLDFFNRLSGKLTIQLSEPPQRVGNLLNEMASPEARVISLKLNVEFFEPETKKFRELSPQEWSSVAFRGPSISLRSEEGDAIEHQAPNGQHFTVADLVAAVEETERQTRDQSEWLGGVDVHHVYFEGLHLNDEDGVYDIYWGS